MKLLIPSAKELNEQARIVEPQPCQRTQNHPPSFEGILPRRISDLYGISEERALVEKERIEALLAGSAKTYPALELFDGLMYRSIERQDLSQKEQTYLQEHLLITTALYGVLPACQRIAPPSLGFYDEAKTSWKISKGILERGL